MTDIEKVARALCDDVGCVWDMDPQSLSRVEWRKAACAAIAAMQPAPQEPVGSAAEITRLTEALREADENINLKADFIDATINQLAAKDQDIYELKEALRAAEEREKGLREAGGRQCDNMAFVLNHFDIPGHWYGKLLAQLETDRQALAGAKP